MTRTSPIVAIDGPVGAGKTTTARKAAEKLGFLYVDTGAMYRAVTLAVLERGADPADEEGVARIAGDVKVEIAASGDGQRTFLDGRDVSGRIRDLDVTRAVSAVSAQRAVRERMWEMQRAAGADGGIVMEGRDIGTVVFPDAEFKIYLDASVEERTRRRHEELTKKGVAISFEELRRDIAERDEANMNRSLAPLKKAPGAIVLDTTGMSFEDQMNAVVDIVRKGGMT